jgi:hypothetical protein
MQIVFGVAPLAVNDPLARFDIEPADEPTPLDFDKSRPIIGIDHTIILISHAWKLGFDGLNHDLAPVVCLLLRPPNVRIN